MKRSHPWWFFSNSFIGARLGLYASFFRIDRIVRTGWNPACGSRRTLVSLQADSRNEPITEKVWRESLFEFRTDNDVHILEIDLTACVFTQDLYFFDQMCTLQITEV